MNIPAFPLVPALAALLLAGCATSPAPRLYVASPDSGWRTAALRENAPRALTLRLAPVRLPAYLDRPQIVTRLSDHEIQADSFHRWGMPLDVLASEILAGTLAGARADADIEVSPLRPMKGPGYLVQVEVVRLDGTLGGPVELIARWTVAPADNEREPVARQLTRHVRDTSGKTYEAYVDALRLTLSDLGSAIAQSIPPPP